mgnify:CR=1 FL=1
MVNKKITSIDDLSAKDIHSIAELPLPEPIETFFLQLTLAIILKFIYSERVFQKISFSAFH